MTSIRPNMTPRLLAVHYPTVSSSVPAGSFPDYRSSSANRLRRPGPYCQQPIHFEIRKIAALPLNPARSRSARS